VRILNENGRLIRASAAHFQEQLTTKGVKRQCLQPLDHADDEDFVPIQTAWFSNPDDSDYSDVLEPQGSRRGPTGIHAPSTSVISSALRMHKHSASAKRSFNLRSQRTVPPTFMHAHLNIASTLEIPADMVPEELYDQKSWKDAIHITARKSG
jgi:hypothetical protein